jgi:hypothetical protein
LIDSFIRSFDSFLNKQKAKTSKLITNAELLVEPPTMTTMERTHETTKDIQDEEN